MQYRRFGRTELAMPVLSCGGMRYQQAWQDLPPDQIQTEGQRNLEATIQRALELGINHIETARGYGSSEMQLGWVLPNLPRDRMIVQTKVGPEPDPAKFRQTFETSLAYLRLDYVDLLGIHGINTREHIQQVLRPGGCLEEAQKLQAAGKVRFIGFSTHGPTDVIVEAIESGAFDYVNLHWYFINQVNWPAIAAAQAQDMGVFIISPSDKGGRLYRPPAKLVDLCRPLSPIAFNDLFCLSQPQIHTLSVGPGEPSHFDAHIEALAHLDRASELLPPILARLEAAAIEAFERNFGPGQGADWLRRWHLGLPKPEATPGGLNLHTLVWLWNLVEAFDLLDYAKMRYGLLGNGGHWFPGTKLDRLTDWDLRPALAHSPYRDRILNQILPTLHARLGGNEVSRLSSV